MSVSSTPPPSNDSRVLVDGDDRGWQLADHLGDMVSAHAPDLCCTRNARQDVARHRSESYDACVQRVTQLLETEAITPVYQPIVALDSGRVIGYEALARFPGDPAHTADRWFADAWQVDLGIPLELLAAHAAVSALPHLPPGVSLSINASPATVATQGFREALGADVDRVVVEITEHQDIDDDAFHLKLAPLRDAGGKVAIDDFGAGHASLSQILTVAPDWIKLDLSLTQSLASKPVARALASAIVGFAEEVGVGVVAEGVEDAHHVAALSSIGIRHAQGHHFGRPVPLERLVAHVG